MSKLLNEYPIIMSHDAATGDIIRDHIVAKWAITQSIGLSGQLDCGTRGFDYRPYYYNGTLYAHHGGVKINKPMKDAVNEVISWCNQHPSEFVLFYTNSCDGDSGCKEAAIELLKSLGVYTITDCNELQSLTINQATSLGKLENGGSLLGLYDCVNEEYDSTINCYGKDFACYESWPNESIDIPWDKMNNYLNSVTSKVPTNDGKLWMTQAHWQSTALSITLGTLHNSSLLLDEERSKMNEYVTNQINNKAYSYLNIIEVDNVCNYGVELFNAIDSYRN